MGVVIPDDILRQAGITEQEALIELACRLFDSDRLDFPAAARLAGLERVQFERELRTRNLPVIHYTQDDFRQDLETIEHLETIRRAEGR
jgi:predicted HTH domain antitoxin